MPAPINIFRGDSPPIAKVQTFTFQNVITGLVFTFSCGNKTVTYTASNTDKTGDVAAAIAALITNAATTMPEFAELTAAAAGNVLTCIAATPGTPFTLVSNLGTSIPSGVVTVVETTKGANPINEVHQIALQGTYSGGTFTLTYSFGTTSAIAYNASAATVQTALAALAGVGAGNVLVTGGPGPNTPWVVTWTGSLAGTSVAAGTVNGSSLTGNATVIIAEQTKGNGLSTEIQGFSLAGITGGTYTLTLDGQATSAIAYNATPATVQTALQALPNVGSGNVTVYGVGAGTGAGQNKDYYWLVFGGALAQQSVNVLTLQAGNLTGPTGQAVVARLQRGGQTVADDFQLIDLGGATGGTYSITYAGVTSTPLDVVADSNGGQTALKVAIYTAAGISANDVTVLGASGAAGLAVEQATQTETNFLVHFTGAKANTAMNLLTVNAGGLTGSSGATVTRVSAGHANVNEQWSIYTTGTGGTFTLTLAAQTTAATAFNATTGTLQTNIQSAFTSSLTTVSVSGSGTPSAPWIVTVTAPADTQLGPPTGIGTSLTGGGGKISELTAAVAGVNEVQTVTLSNALGGSPTGGTWTLSFEGQTTANINWNDSSATVQTRLQALSTINTATVSGSAGGPYTVTWSGAEGSAAQPILAGNGAGLTSASASTVTQLTTTRSSGPHHFDDPLNWSLARLPNSGDALYFETGSSDCLYGLNQMATFSWTSGTTLQLASFSAQDPAYHLQNGQSVYLTSTNTLPTGLSTNTLYYIVGMNFDAGTFGLSTTLGGAAITVTGAGTGTHTIGIRLASLELNSRWTGGLGLPEQNSNNYLEYRQRYLHVGLATVAQGGSTCIQSVTIGTENGSGSGRVHIDNDVDLVAVNVINTGGSVDSGIPTVVWKGQNASNTFALLNGSAGIALYPGETAQLGATAPAAALIQRAGTLELGTGLTITGPISRTAGTLISDNATINGTLLMSP